MKRRTQTYQIDYIVPNSKLKMPKMNVPMTTQDYLKVSFFIFTVLYFGVRIGLRI